MEIGKIVKHKHKESTSGYPHDKKYIIYGKCRMKNPTTREWVDAIQYVEADNIKSQIYVREKQDFENEFKVV